MAAKTKHQDEVIQLLPIHVTEFEVTIVGSSPLIVHRFTEKARKQIEDKQQKRAQRAKEARDPHEEYLASLYVFPGDVAGVEGARYGVPALWFKCAMVDACRYTGGLTMTAARGAFHVLGESPQSGGLVLLNYTDLRMRDDAVTIGIGTRDMRYRGEFSNWSVRLKIRYNASVISPDQLVNLLNVAGFGTGVGERRPSQSCSDMFGMWAVEG